MFYFTYCFSISNSRTVVFVVGFWFLGGYFIFIPSFSNGTARNRLYRKKKEKKGKKKKSCPAAVSSNPLTHFNDQHHIYPPTPKLQPPHQYIYIHTFRQSSSKPKATLIFPTPFPLAWIPKRISLSSLVFNERAYTAQ